MGTRIAFVIVLAVMSPGCTTLASVTSGHIGCPEEEIRIYNDRQSWGSRSWSARCRGRVYHCIGISGGKYGAPHVSCKPEPGSTTGGLAPTLRRPSRGGCQYDNQCKGDRICQDGRCVYPNERTSRGSSVPARPPPRRVEPVTPPVVAAIPFVKRLGIEVGDAAKHVEALGLKTDQGAVVLSAQRGGVAHRRNIRRGDVIVGLDTSRVKNEADLTRIGRRIKPGRKFHIIVRRGKRLFSFYMKF